MKNLFNNLETFKKKYLLITFIIGILVTVFSLIHNVLNQYDELLLKLNTTQQMSLKSVIWNTEIPDAERASACDVYLAAGYNSLTKKKCELIVNQNTDFSVFSMGGKNE